MSKMYDVIQELCRRNKTDVTKMCRALGIPRSTLSELATGRTRQLSLKHAQPIADYFGVTLGQLAGAEPLDEATDAIRDEPVAAYENLTRYLTEQDKEDIVTLIRLRAELNRGRR
ncbi:MAG: helix-turn-helix transcriptional regulator [Oscillospiraceae bacterium]|nr:helix-turn-helix transcriptional regulator [Oscillospiraceae bacterium]